MFGWLKKKPPKTSKAYWSRPDSYPESWGERAEIAARHIAAGSAVLDIGCGRMQLRTLLPEGCRYTPADMTKWTDEVHQVDLDKGEFPPGTYDVVTLLGVLEYLQDPSFALARAREASGRLITTYCHPVAGADIPQRRQAGWINDLAVADLTGRLEAAGWVVKHQEIIQTSKKFSQSLYVCDRR